MKTSNWIKVRYFGLATIFSVLVSILAVNATARAYEPLFVRQGSAKILKLRSSATDVIIADPSIADVSIQTANKIVLIGKKYGTTQLIVMSDDSVLIDSEVVVSSANQSSVVSVFSGGKSGVIERSFACYKRCASSSLVSSAEGGGGQAITVTLGNNAAGGEAPTPGSENGSAAPALSNTPVAPSDAPTKTTP